MANSDAPRFRAAWERAEQRSVLTMARSDWEALVPHLGQPIQIDVERTPMRRVKSAASLFAAWAEQYSSATGSITIVRYDAADQPTPYNEDRYTVWVDPTSHRSFAQFLASTEYNQSFRSFLQQNVLLVKQDLGPDHWLPDPPGPAWAVVRST